MARMENVTISYFRRKACSKEHGTTWRRADECVSSLFESVQRLMHVPAGEWFVLALNVTIGFMGVAPTVLKWHGHDRAADVTTLASGVMVVAMSLVQFSKVASRPVVLPAS